jgi:hypothetical protein
VRGFDGAAAGVADGDFGLVIGEEDEEIGPAAALGLESVSAGEEEACRGERARFQKIAAGERGPACFW